MNNAKFNEILTEQTNYTNEQISIIDEIIGEHFIVGRKNKDLMIKDFVEKLNIDEIEANTLYNTCMGIIMNSLKEKIKHPFKKDEE